MRRRNEVLVGVVTSIAVVAGLIGTLWLARGGLQPGYPLFVKFAWGAGLKQGQPVLLSGVNIGYVQSVDLQPDGWLVVHMRVRKQYKVPHGTTAAIEPNGFFGDMLIALKPSKPSATSFQPKDTIPSGKQATQLADVLSHVDSITTNLAQLTSTLNKEFVGQSGIKDLHATITQTSALIAKLGRVADQQNAELTKTQESLRHVANAVDSARINGALQSLTDAGHSTSDLAKELAQTSAKLQAVLAKVDSGKGSAARLMNDDGLYRDTRALLQRLDSLTADFKKNPRKYIKLSIF
jgi:phospholipid/cholesterol/gamma-HCH transport system substrate-binding protein